MSMMTGEVNYNDLMYRSQWKYDDSGRLQTETIKNSFPLTSMILLGLFIFIIPIIMMNLFFGIAVNDVQRIMEMSLINQNIKLINVIWRYEKVLNRVCSKRLKNFIKRRLESKDMKDSA